MGKAKPTLGKHNGEKWQGEHKPKSERVRNTHTCRQEKPECDRAPGRQMQQEGWAKKDSAYSECCWASLLGGKVLCQLRKVLSSGLTGASLIFLPQAGPVAVKLGQSPILCPSANENQLLPVTSHFSPFPSLPPAHTADLSVGTMSSHRAAI